MWCHPTCPPSARACSPPRSPPSTPPASHPSSCWRTPPWLVWCPSYHSKPGNARYFMLSVFSIPLFLVVFAWLHCKVHTGCIGGLVGRRDQSNVQYQQCGLERREENLRRGISWLRVSNRSGMNQSCSLLIGVLSWTSARPPANTWQPVCCVC